MKNKWLNISVIFVMLMVFVSCTDNGPVNHTSIAGTWRCQEYGSFGNRSYLVDIDRKVSDTTQYVISNFYNTGDVEYIVVKLKNGKLSLIQQPTSNISVSAFTANVVDLKYINFSYKVFDGSNDISVSAEYTRK